MLTLDKEANKTPVLNSSEKDLKNQHMKEPERERVKEKIRKLAQAIPRCLKHNRITHKGAHKVLPKDIKD